MGQVFSDIFNKIEEQDRKARERVGKQRIYNPTTVRELKQEEGKQRIYNQEEDYIVGRSIVPKVLVVHKREEENLRIKVGNREKEETIVKPKIWEAEKRIQHYSSKHKILLVGEGDFSFSACLARAFGSASNMVATSLDLTSFLFKNYKQAMSNIYELKQRGCTVMHGVDATKLDDYAFLEGMEFDRIIYNFPLAGFFKDESRESQIMKNQMLVMLFFKNAKNLLVEGGEIHITHKSSGFFLEWDLEWLGYKNGLRLMEEVQFELKSYPGYNNKYGFGGDNNFDYHPSKTYKFVF